MVDFVYKENYDVADFRKIIEILRGEGGCPWDREQTHESIRRNLLEEAYEVCEAIDEQSTEHLKEELGDLLMQVIFHARIEEEQGSFNLDDVADRACKKLILRHPHVFASTIAETSDVVLDNWEKIKRVEKSQKTVTSSMEAVAKSLPATWRAEKIQKKARAAGFDWPDISGAIEKLEEELGELKAAIALGEGVDEELGDLLFSAVNVSRFLDVDAEKALHDSCDKFTARFSFIEREAISQGRQLESLSLDEQEALYQLGKITK